MFLALVLLIQVCVGQATADCLACHRGIEPIAVGEMQEEIERLGIKHGDPGGCIPCHGGDPEADEARRAHRGVPEDLARSGGPQSFYSDPGAPEIADQTCGQCHAGYAERWRKSSMSTEAGVIDGGLCDAAWRKRRARNGTDPVHFGRYPILDEDGPEPAVGSHLYRTWMRSKTRAFPQHWPSRLLAVPAQPWSSDQPHPSAGCKACHGRAVEKSHRPGCSVCHIRRGPYAGSDPTIPRDSEHTPLVHRIQGSGRAHLARSDGSAVSWLGVALETCFKCHFDPRTIARNSTGDAAVHYGHHSEDAADGLWCQDCHTSIEMHGDGNIPATGAGQEEIRCEDCHGTLEKPPWQLPLAELGPAGEPFQSQAPRGLMSAEGKPVDAADLSQGGELLTSRGNPFGNVYREGDRVYLRSVSGRTYPVSLLATLAANDGWSSALSRQVKSSPELHKGMGCMDCHADWQPTCPGCHVDPPAAARE